MKVTVCLLGAAASMAPVAHATEAKAANPDLVSTLRLNVHPPTAHVYVEHSVTSCDSRHCTGWCTLELRPGRYNIRAGLAHSALGTADEALLLIPGTEQMATVHVDERLALVWTFGGIALAGMASTITGLTLYGFSQVDRGERARIDSLPGVLTLGGLGVAIGAMSVLLFGLDTPSVRVDHH